MIISQPVGEEQQRRIIGPALIAVVCLLLSTAPGIAAAPEVTALSPAGGQRGTTVSVKISGNLDKKPVSVWASRDGLTAKVDPEKSTAEITIADDAEPGLIWLRFTNQEGTSVLRPFEIGVLPEVQEKEPNNLPDQATPGDAPAFVANGILHAANEVDCFAIDVPAGSTLVASMDAHRSFGSPMDGLIQIVSPDGFVVAQNDDAHGFDPQIAWQPAEAGRYIVRVFAFPEQPNSSVRLAGGATYIYRLTITTGPFVTHSLPLSLTRGTPQSVALRGWNIPTDLQAVKIEPQSTSAEEAADRFTLYQPGLSAPWKLAMVEHPSLTETGTAAAAEPQQVPVPADVTGVIANPGEIDHYRFTAKKGDRLRFQVDSRGLGFPLDALLRLTDSTGKLIKRLDDAARDNFDVDAVQPIAADGEYRLEVSDLFQHGGPQYAYRLRITHETPDFALSVAADNFLLTGEKPLEIPVTITRLGRATQEIEVIATGLPENVTAEPVISQGKGDTAKSVKLILKAKPGTTFNEPFRIEGRFKPAADAEGKAEEQPMQQAHPATATTAGVGHSSADLWLTVREVTEPKPEEKPKDKP